MTGKDGHVVLKQKISILWAILAAALYAVSSPVSKILLVKLSPTFIASLLYLGAGMGMSFIAAFRNRTNRAGDELQLTKRELPYILGMIVLDIAAPVFLMLGLSLTTPANVSLLNNFEIVTTSLIAYFIFKEAINRRLWLGIGLITLASMILSVENIRSLSFSFGSLFTLSACICWGFENNCTRMLSRKDPLKVVIIKGFGSGTGALFLSLLRREASFHMPYIFAALLLGFVSYGLSIYFYVYAQRELGAAKTSAYYAIAPFIGVSISLVMFRQLPGITFIIALLIMISGTYFTTMATPKYNNRQAE